MMKGLLVLFLFVLTDAANATLWSAKTQLELTDSIAQLDAALLSEETEKFSQYFIQGLLDKQVELIQFFADEKVTAAEKNELLDLYNQLNVGLNALGVSYQQLKAVPRAGLLRGTGNSVIRGFVRDAANESPISDANVYLYDSAGTYLASERTDSVGRYIITGLNPGQYLVSASKNLSSYVVEFYQDQLCPGGLGFGCQPVDLDVLTLAAGEQLEQINFNLQKRGKIIGQLSDEVSKQSINAAIKLHDASGNVVLSVNSLYSTGEFTLFVPDAAAYFLTFESRDYRKEAYEDVYCDAAVCDFTDATVVSVQVADELNLGDIKLLKNSRISGQVKDASTEQAPPNLRQVEIRDAETNQYYDSFYPESDGNWVSPPLPLGNYHISAQAGGYLAQYYDNHNCSGYNTYSCDNQNADSITHDGINNTTGVDFSLMTGGKIKGRVRDFEGNPTRGFVTLYNASGFRVGNEYTEDDGLYAFSGLSDGTYYLSAKNDAHLLTMYNNKVCSDYYNHSSHCNSATEGTAVELSDGLTITRIINLKMGATVRGRVTNLSNVSIDGALIFAYSEFGFEDTVTDDFGNFEIAGLRPGSYQFSAAATGHTKVLWKNTVCQSFIGCDITHGDSLTVNGSNLYDISRFRLPQLGLVKFTVTDNNSQPVTSGVIRAYDNNNKNVAYGSVNGQGEATLNLYPGNHYFIYETSHSSDYLFRVYGGDNCYQNCQPMSGTAVSVGLGQSKNLSIRVNKAFKLQGTITQEESTDYNRMYMRIYQNDELVENIRVFSGGQFENYIKLSGQIKVEAYQEGHFSNYFQGVACHGTECGLSQATAINVVPNQTKNIDFDLTILNRMKGRVVNSSGQPITGVQVKAYTENQYPTYSAYTDNNGRFEFFGLLPGEYNVRAITNGVYESTLYGNISCPNPCAFDANQVIDMELGGDLSNRNITMSKRGVITVSAAEFINGDLATGTQVVFVSLTNGYKYIHQTDGAGDINEVSLPADTYRIYARVGNYNNYLYTAYPDVLCASSDVTSCLSGSPEFVVNTSTSHDITDLKINQHGKASVQFIDETTAEPISGITLQLINSELEVLKQSYSQNGLAEINNINNGFYYLYASVGFNDAYQNNLFDGIDCGRGLGIDCLLSDGNLVEIQLNTTQNLVMVLKKKPILSIDVVNAFNGTPVEGDRVYIYNSSGDQLYQSNITSSLDVPVFAGQYYITGSANKYNTKVYPSGICENANNIDSCDLSAATLVSIDDQNSSVELELDLIQGINGYVSNAYTDEPLAGVVIDFWRSQNYVYESAITDENGRFSVALNSYYDYLVSTDASWSLNLYNEVYNNHKCFEGPAVTNMCDPSIGEWVEIDQNAEQPIMIDFKLDGDEVFMGGFEQD